MFPRIYETKVCPIADYGAYSLRLLLNPTRLERQAWFEGIAASDTDMGALAAACVAVYGETKAEGLDFATAENARATLENPALPDELLTWLILLPGETWAARADDIRKKLQPPSPTGG